MEAQMYDLIFAEELILERCVALGTERIPVVNAAGRILACDIMGGDCLSENETELIQNVDKIVVKKGSVIKPIAHGALVSLRINEVEVYRKPLIGFFFLESTEHADNSGKNQAKLNRYILGNALKEAEFSWIYQGSVPEDSRQIATTIKTASAVYDAIVICGGPTQADFRRMQHVVEQTGAEVVVRQIDMKPGSTFCAGFIDHVPVFGMTGDPAGVLTELYLSVMPALKKISGRGEEAHTKIMVELNKDFNEYNEETRILLGRLEFSDGIVRMHLEDDLSDGRNIWSLHDVDVCAVVPAGSGPLKKGTLLDAYKVKK